MIPPTILVTGMTGFVGGALAARLVAERYSLMAVVRGKCHDDARLRVARSLSRFLGPGEGEKAAEAIDILVGDLGSKETYDRPELDRVTHVVHSAACTSFAPSREVWRSNVEGTKQLADRMGNVAGLRRFLHVSTAYCCGDRPNMVVRENDAPRTEHAHVNDYARSKAAAELVLDAMDWKGRLIVARPSVIIGHTLLGVGPSSSLFWYYRALAALRCGPFAVDDLRDIVPVDYVAGALHFLLMLEQPKFRVYHVSAGARGSRSLGEILCSFHMPGMPTETPEWQKISASSFIEMRDAIRGLARDGREAAKLARALRACAAFGELGVQFFDNERLLSEGFRAPPPFVDYVERCMQTSAGATIYDQMVDDA